jgi:hypothetical protein
VGHKVDLHNPGKKTAGILATANLVLLDEGLVDDPRGVADDFVHPATVAKGLVPLCLIHHRFALVPVG